MDHHAPDASIMHPAGRSRPRPVSPERAARDEADAAALVAGRPLGELLVAMQSDRAALREAAWAECYRRHYQLVWTRAFYVIRSIAWLPEPREVAADVASDVFVGLPDAARHYREEGGAEWWLKQVVVRTALRRKEALTGRGAAGRGAAAPGRSTVALDETADEIVDRCVESVERAGLLQASGMQEQL